MFAEGAERPFIAEIVLFTILVRNELFVFLVDAVVGQVHVFVLLVYFLRVGFGGESGQTFLMYVDSKRFI